MKHPQADIFRMDLRSQEERRALLHCGVQNMVFAQKGFSLENTVGIIEGSTVTGRPKVIKAQTQLEQYKQIEKDILGVGPFVFCVASTGTDLRAKYVAAHMLGLAVRSYNEKARYEGMLGDPKWHVLTGSYQDLYRDRAQRVHEAQQLGKPPSMLVLTNMTQSSSQMKKEKLRDILELYSGIPRIVTLTGADPVTFFNTELNYTLNAALYLNRVTAGRSKVQSI